MSKTLIQLPEKTHLALKHLAVDHNTSVGQLIRNAIDTVYKEDLEQIERAEKLLAKYKLGSGTTLEDFHVRRSKSK